MQLTKYQDAHFTLLVLVLVIVLLLLLLVLLSKTSLVFFATLAMSQLLKLKWMTRVPCETVEGEFHVSESLRTLSRIVCKWKRFAQLKGKALTRILYLYNAKKQSTWCQLRFVKQCVELS